MSIVFHPYDQGFVDRVRRGGPDANGQTAERAISTGSGVPCRSCLRDVPEGREFLILSARPFPRPQPYAEQGPIFLCADACEPWAADGVPPILASSPDYLLKGYSADDRIVYGTGRVVPAVGLTDYAEAVLSDQKVAYVDVRSARNNCFQARITRGA